MYFFMQRTTLDKHRQAAQRPLCEGARLVGLAGADAPLFASAAQKSHCQGGVVMVVNFLTKTIETGNRSSLLRDRSEVEVSFIDR
jgi:hypothetical protein